MSSEEMRTELEIFVNEGLREGWRGWPRCEGRNSLAGRRNEENGTYRTDKMYGAGQGCHGLYWLHRFYRSC
jgi:hypothetical protein